MSGIAAAAPAQTLMYLCYGSRAVRDQAIYSILSLLHITRDAHRAYRIVVYSDQPSAFHGLPVEVRAVGAEDLDAWLGGGDYVHRRKSMALIDAIERFGGRIAFIDTDTWFRRDPSSLFDRIGPGRACLHLCEGYLRSTGTPSDEALARQLAAGRVRDAAGTPVLPSRRTRMWNTGVIGVDAADLARVRAALALSDAIWADADPAGAYGRKIHHAEQFAMGHAFGDCRLGETADVVHHYWPAATKEAFSARLPDLLAAKDDLSPASLARLYAERPRERGRTALRDRIKMRVRKVALAAGVPVRGVRRSVA